MGRSRPGGTGEPRTLWHLALTQMVIERAPPVARISAEVPLGVEPMRADLMIIALPPAHRRDGRARILKGLWAHLPKRTVLEFKSLLRGLRAGGLAKLQAYGDRYYSEEVKGLRKPTDLALVLLVVSITPTLRRELTRMSWIMSPMTPGYYCITNSFFPTFIGVIDEISDAEHDALLDSVGRGRMIDGTVGAWWSERMLPTPEARRLMNAKHTTREALEFMRRLPPKFRARTIDGAAIRLVPPAVYREGLSMLTPQERLADLTPEQRLADLTPEQKIAAMPVEFLRALSPAYVDSLPAEVRAEIKRRLRKH